ncbi:MAG: UvrB/UvrC motif-containing protein [Verrucomicrobiota bacterium]|jgi:protein arginine kinase activator
MSKPLKCSLCEEAATVHLSQVVHGKVTKVHLCEACAQKGGATDPAVFQLADALTAATPAAPTITCPQCGFTDIDFRKRGRLGCPSCWETFGDALGGLLAKVQHEPEHVGRAPAGVLPAAQLRRRLVAARLEMEKSISAEDYEVAARLRDEIAALEKQLTPS